MMRRKSRTMVGVEAKLAAIVKHVVGYRWMSEERRAAFDLRREFYRVEPGYVGQLAVALLGFVMAAVGFGVADLLPSRLDPRTVVGWALGLIGLALGIRALRRAWRSVDRLKHIDVKTYYRGEKLPSLLVDKDVLPFDEIAPEPSETLDDLVIAIPPLAREAAERSTSFDDALIATPSLPFRHGGDRTGSFYRGNAKIRGLQLDYLRYRVEEKVRTTNEPKFGLIFPLELPLRDVELYTIGYYDALLTNEAFRSCIAGRPNNDKEGIPSSDTQRLDGSFPLAPGISPPRLLSLAAANVANHVGVTTLAITADGRPLLFRQGGHSAINQGCLVFAGSGSVDADDVAAAEDPGDIKSILRHAMARELQQETLLVLDGAELAESRKEEESRLLDYRSRTVLIGFFRWVNRCGKPEFVGITVVPQSYAELKENSRELSPIPGELNLPTLTRMADLPLIAEEVKRWMAGDRPQPGMGLSSAIALLRAGEIARSDPDSPAFAAVDHLLGAHVRDWRRA